MSKGIVRLVKFGPTDPDRGRSRISAGNETSSGEGRCAGHFIPNAEAFSSMATVISGGEQMAAGAEVRSNDSVNLEESLGVLART